MQELRQIWMRSGKPLNLVEWILDNFLAPAIIVQLRRGGRLRQIHLAVLVLPLAPIFRLDFLQQTLGVSLIAGIITLIQLNAIS